MVVAQDRGVEVVMARVQEAVRMQVVEVEVKGVAVANTMVLDLVAGLVPAPAQVDIVKICMKVMLLDLLTLAVPVVAVVEDKQPEIIMDLVAMDLVVVVDQALAMQLINTMKKIPMQMHIPMVVAVAADMAQMVGVEVAVALDLVLAMPTRNTLDHANQNMKPNLLYVEWVSYNLF
jgi:hypothetical protein